MLNRIRELFTPELQEEEHLDEEHLRIATCIVLLEVADSDEEFSDTERKHVVEALQGRYQLSEEDAHELVDAAIEHRETSHDLWQYTNRINQTCSHQEKIDVIEEVWRVIYADHAMSGHEDYVVHKLARLFNLTHRQLIDAKLRILDEVRERT